jgi:hypothetical protein
MFATIYSSHGRGIFPNLSRDMVLTGLDQLWIADITYARLRDEFVFLAVILKSLLAPGRWLGTGSHAGGFACPSGAPQDARAPEGWVRIGPSFRSRLPVRPG